MNTYQIWLGTTLVYSVKGHGISNGFDGSGNTIYINKKEEDGVILTETVAWVPNTYAIIQDQ